LPEAADLLADFSRQHNPEWLRGVGRRYPSRSEEAAVAASLVYFALFGLHDGNPEDEEKAPPSPATSAEEPIETPSRM
jgi:hypothetical protein